MLANPVLLFQFTATFCAAIAVSEGFFILWQDRFSAKTTGTICELSEAPAGPSNHFALAAFSYTVDGKEYHSKNKIRVPKNCKVGDERPVWYLLASPETLSASTMVRFVVSGAAAMIFFLVGRIVKAHFQII